MLSLLNRIDRTSETFQEDLVRQVLQKLLLTNGIRLPTASTILRFRNPRAFQIIDQRAYRFIYEAELPTPNYFSDKAINEQIELYFSFLSKLKEVANETGREFSKLDRILYAKDKKENSNEPLHESKRKAAS